MLRTLGSSFLIKKGDLSRRSWPPWTAVTILADSVHICLFLFLLLVLFLGWCRGCSEVCVVLFLKESLLLPLDVETDLGSISVASLRWWVPSPQYQSLSPWSLLEHTRYQLERRGSSIFPLGNWVSDLQPWAQCWRWSQSRRVLLGSPPCRWRSGWRGVLDHQNYLELTIPLLSS